MDPFWDLPVVCRFLVMEYIIKSGVLTCAIKVGDGWYRKLWIIVRIPTYLCRLGRCRFLAYQASERLALQTMPGYAVEDVSE